MNRKVNKRQLLFIQMNPLKMFYITETVKNVIAFCQGVECRAVLGSAQKGSGAAKITFIYIFRAYPESMA